MLKIPRKHYYRNFHNYQEPIIFVNQSYYNPNEAKTTQTLNYDRDLIRLREIQLNKTKYLLLIRFLLFISNFLPNILMIKTCCCFSDTSYQWSWLACLTFSAGYRILHALAGVKLALHRRSSYLTYIWWSSFS